MTVGQSADLRHLSPQASTMRAELMAVGGFILGLGIALVVGSPSIPQIVYNASVYNLKLGISISNSVSISFWLLWMGIALSPVGLMILAYGVGAEKSLPEAVPTEPVPTETSV